MFVFGRSSKYVALLLPVASFLAALLFCASVPDQAFGQRQPATVNVRVTEFDSEEPVFQADVSLSVFARGVYTFRGFTDGSGRITFSGVERGSYVLEVRKDGYESTRESVDVSPGANAYFPVRLPRRAGSPPPMPPGGKVSADALAVPAPARKEYESGLIKVTKDPGGSIPNFRRAIQQYAQYAEAYAMLGVAQMRAKQGDEAMKSLTRAIELNPKLRLARTSMGELLLERKEYARAESELLESSRLDPQAWDTAFHLARCYFNMGKLDQALEYARRAESLPGAPSTTHLLLVDIYLRRNDQQAALHELEDFAKANPNSPLMPRVQQRIAQLRKQNPN